MRLTGPWAPLWWNTVEAISCRDLYALHETITFKQYKAEQDQAPAGKVSKDHDTNLKLCKHRSSRGSGANSAVPASYCLFGSWYNGSGVKSLFICSVHDFNDVPTQSNSVSNHVDLTMVKFECR